MKKIEIEALKSKIITAKDDLLKVIINALKKRPLLDGDILNITSKVVAVTQGRVCNITNKNDFDQLVKREAEQVIETEGGINQGPQVTLTLSNGIFIPWAGIDRSNIQKGKVVLWPNEPFKAAAQIQGKLKKHFKLKKLGIIISDSTCRPLRKGVSGIALGFAGFKGVNDLRGQKDLYGNELKVTQQAVADNLATAAHLVMGEGSESTPFVIIRNAPVTFTDAEVDSRSLLIDKDECLFNPLYRNK